MTTYKLTTCTLYANLDAGWTDISLDVVGSVQPEWGISGTTPNDRLANTGTMQFSLRNNDGNYTPGGASVTAGWEKGCSVKLEAVYDTDTYIKFIGTLDNIDLVFTPGGIALANATVVDWMNYAAEHPITTPALQTDKRADEAIDAILVSMPITPANKSLEAGISTFPSVFDVVRKKSKALSELSSIVNSELGYLYLQKEKETGEKLVFENSQHRNGLLALSTIPVLVATAGYILMETGDKILQETGDKIYKNEVTTVNFTNGMTAIEVDHGANIANRVVVTAYPRKVDTNLVVLYTLGSPMEIGAGETVTFTGNYTFGGQGCGGSGMVTPVVTTDYTLNTLADGTGTDLTADAIVSATFGGNSASNTVQNTTLTAGYITFFRLRGYGVYTYDETILELEDADSINDYGYFERSFDQKYQGDLVNGGGVGRTSLYYDHYPRTVLQSFTYCANKSSENLLCFLNHDIGSLITVSESGSGISGVYFIQNVSFTIQPGGIIWVTYGLVEHWSLLTSTMTSLDMEFYISGKKGSVNYGYLPQISQTTDRSWAAWIYRHADAEVGAVMAAPFSDGGGIYIYISANDRPVIYSSLFASPGQWNAPTDTILQSGWHHLVITYDTDNAAADPVIYIDGTSRAVAESATPSGAANGEYGAEMVIGNWHTATQDYGATLNGHLKDVRIYNRILTQAEVTTLYNAGVCDPLLVTDGLVFQGPVVRTSDIALYDGIYLSSGLQVLDNIYQAVGTPTGISLATAI